MTTPKTTMTLTKNDIEWILEGLDERLVPKMDLIENYLEEMEETYGRPDKLNHPFDKHIKTAYNQLKQDLKEMNKLKKRFEKKLEKLK